MVIDICSRKVGGKFFLTTKINEKNTLKAPFQAHWFCLGMLARSPAISVFQY